MTPPEIEWQAIVEVPLSDLKAGSWFAFGGHLYMRTHAYAQRGALWAVWDFTADRATTMSLHSPVRPVRVRITVL